LRPNNLIQGGSDALRATHPKGSAFMKTIEEKALVSKVHTHLDLMKVSLIQFEEGLIDLKHFRNILLVVAKSLLTNLK